MFSSPLTIFMTPAGLDPGCQYPSCTGEPKVDTVIQTQSCKCQIESKDHLPGSCSFMFNLSTKTPRSFSAELLSKQPQASTDAGHYSLYSFTDSRLHASLVELYVVPVSLLLQLIQLPLNCSPALQHIDCSPQFGVEHKLPKNRLCPLIWVISEGIGHSTDSRGTSSGCQSIFGLC